MDIRYFIDPETGCRTSTDTTSPRTTSRMFSVARWRTARDESIPARLAGAEGAASTAPEEE
jgi:hypothetical protein